MTQKVVDDNQTQGQYLYAVGDQEAKDWFHRQWKIWPKRADERLTTNISLHYGGILGYRAEHGSNPEMSADLTSHISWLDSQTQKD